MKTCPVCLVDLEETTPVCHVCDADLSVVMEMDHFNMFIRDAADRFRRTDDRGRAFAYTRLAMGPG
jgi:hypothetical protein